MKIKLSGILLTIGLLYAIPRSVSAEQTVQVDASPLVPEIAHSEYEIGEALDLTGSCLKIGNLTIPMKEGMLSGFDSSVPGRKTVNGTYKGKDFTFVVEVKEPLPAEVQAAQAPMRLDDEFFYIGEGQEESHVSQDIADGSGAYAAKLKTGYQLKGTGIKVVQYPGDEGSRHFTFKVSSSFTGTVVLPFLITDQADGSEMEVHMVFVSSPLSAECEIEDVTLQSEAGETVYPGRIRSSTDQPEELAVEVKVPAGTDTENLRYRALQVSDKAKVKLPDEKRVCDAKGSPVPLVVTAQDGTQKTYPVKLIEVPKEAVQLAAPEGAAWEGSMGRWTAVEGASEYQVSLHRWDPTPPGQIEGKSKVFFTSENQMDFTGAMTSPGSYVFHVTAIGDGTAAADSAAVQSDAYTYASMPAAAQVTLSPQTRRVYRGAVLEMQAMVSGSGQPDRSVQWSLEGALSGNTTISETGVLTVGEDEGDGPVSILATSVQTPEIIGKAVVTVSDRPALMKPEGLGWEWTGKQVVEQAEVHWDAVQDAVGYSVVLLNDEVPVGAPLSAGEKTYLDVTKEITGPGSYSFLVTALGDAEHSQNSRASASDVHVYTPEAEVTGITIDPAEATVDKGCTTVFHAAVLGAGNPSQEVLFTVSGASSKKTMIKEDTGVLQVAADEKASKLTVTAASAVNSQVLASAAVSIGASQPEVTDVTVTPGRASVNRGGTQTFTAAVTGVNAPSKEVRWSIEEAVVNGTSVSDKGVLTVAAGEGLNYLTVRATAAEDPAVYGTAVIAVSGLPKLPDPVGMVWQKGVAAWSALAGAASYELELYKNGIKYLDTVTLAETAYDYTPWLKESGEYVFRLTASGDGVQTANSNQVSSGVLSYKAAAVISGVQVTPQEPFWMNAGESKNFAAEVVGTDRPSQAVLWAVTGQGSAGTKVDQKGLLIVGEDETSAAIKVWAFAASDQTKVGSTAVSVVPKPGPVKKVKELISELPVPEKVRESDAGMIGNAKAQYDQLSMEQKDRLSEAELTKLCRTIEAVPHMTVKTDWQDEESGREIVADYISLAAAPEEISGVEPVTLTLEVEPLQGAEDAAVLEQAAEQNAKNIGQLYRISLLRQVNQGEPQPISPADSIRVVLTIPKSVLKKDRVYQMLYTHDGKAAELASQTTGNEITFYTGQPSTYAIAYGNK